MTHCATTAAGALAILNDKRRGYLHANPAVQHALTTANERRSLVD